MTFWLWCAVAAVGGCGAIARFLLDATDRRDGSAATSRSGRSSSTSRGAFVLGLLTGAGLAPDALLVAGTATIGSYTTFSTWMLESQRLVEEGEARGVAINLLFSLVVGVAAAALGRTIGAQL